jgi:hypothetical protein
LDNKEQNSLGLLVKGFGSGTTGFVGRGRKARDVYGDYAVTMPSL